MRCIKSGPSLLGEAAELALESELKKLRCRVVDPEEAHTATHRQVLLMLAQTFDDVDVVLLCEPSVVGARSGRPDITIIDPKSGLHVVEIKGVALDRVRAVNAGGAIEIDYGGNISRKDPSRQAMRVMFDVKDTASRHFNGELHVPFQSWVVFPSIKRGEWEDRFGDAISRRSDVIFSEDLDSSSLREQLQQEGIARLRAFGLRECPRGQLRSVMAAFGDSAVITPPPRPVGAAPPDGSKGERLEEALAEYRALTHLQQRLTSRIWDDGPRLLRGVAGSGKTVVLATQAARMIERLHEREGDLFESEAAPPPVLAICFNRSLAPFIRERIEIAYRQRNNKEMPTTSLLVTHFNSLLYKLYLRGYCGYYRIDDFRNPGDRALKYLSDIEATSSGEQYDRIAQGLFHAVYVDEGQDFHENEFRILLKLCARKGADQPRFFVFYDDAQNLYGHGRPVWTDLGLEIRGRSVVMDECFRNTRQIVEPAFNLLLGVHADDPASVATRGFADTQTLKEKGLIDFRSGHVRVKFTKREGDRSSFCLCNSARDEEIFIAKRCEELMSSEGLLPQDILVVTLRRARALEIAKAIAGRIGHERVRCPFRDKDDLAIQTNKITVSTVASVKGYDAPYVMVAALNDFHEDVEGRACLYVAFTRAREWLHVSAVQETRLVAEYQRALSSSV